MNEGSRYEVDLTYIINDSMNPNGWSKDQVTITVNAVGEMPAFQKACNELRKMDSSARSIRYRRIKKVEEASIYRVKIEYSECPNPSCIVCGKEDELEIKASCALEASDKAKDIIKAQKGKVNLTFNVLEVENRTAYLKNQAKQFEPDDVPVPVPEKKERKDDMYSNVWQYCIVLKPTRKEIEDEEKKVTMIVPPAAENYVITDDYSSIERTVILKHQEELAPFRDQMDRVEVVFHRFYNH